MAVLIEVRNSSGVIGRCDAKCYDAETQECHCICGGQNHGAGLERAIRNTRKYADQWLTRYARQHGLTDFRSEIGHEVTQLKLF
ncbi:MAG: hypothetical protein D6675_10330 [Gemmatimonadetes bacterium]|nr:MAG: hypothetical protein D6675_10330 [Gemmatimonadota bacterium]